MIRSHHRRYIVRVFTRRREDIRQFATDDPERFDAMARQMSEDLEDIEKIDQRAKGATLDA